MKDLIFFYIHILIFAITVHAISIPFERSGVPSAGLDIEKRRKEKHKHKHHDDEDERPASPPPPSKSKSKITQPAGNVINYYDIRYNAKLTLNGRTVVLALDTGSSDTWISNPKDFLGQFNDTGVKLELLYGDGTYGVNGTISYAPMEFGEYKLEKQAFLNVYQNSFESITNCEADGLLGLSFSNGSCIDLKTRETHGPDVTESQAFLPNLFKNNPSLPNFIAIRLSRTSDQEETAGGNLDIGTVDSRYTAIHNAPKLAQFPKNAGAWTTLLDSIRVDGREIPLNSSVKNAPKGKAVALLDTGAPTGRFSVKLLNAIYKPIPGSAYDEGSKQWVLPCDCTSMLEFSFGGQNFSMHPLDLTTPRVKKVNGKEYTVCTSAFISYDEHPIFFDVSLGDSFLRNTYSLYHFGDRQANGPQGEPYMQLLSTIDAAKASVDTIQFRKMKLQDWPEQVTPVNLIGLLQRKPGI